MNMTKRITGILLAVSLLIAAAGAAGCKKASIESFGKSNEGILLYRDLALEDVLIDSFDESKLDFDEYRSLLDEEIGDYNRTNEFRPGDESKRSDKEPEYTAPITVTKCEVSGGKLTQQLLYANVQDYLSYNEDVIEARGGSKLSCGTLAGVDTTILTADIVSPGKGERVDVQALCLAPNAGSYRYVIADFSAVLYGEGEVIGYSANGAYDAATNSVKVNGGEPVIVLYK